MLRMSSSDEHMISQIFECTGTVLTSEMGISRCCGYWSQTKAEWQSSLPTVTVMLFIGHRFKLFCPWMRHWGSAMCQRCCKYIIMQFNPPNICLNMWLKSSKGDLFMPFKHCGNRAWPHLDCSEKANQMMHNHSKTVLHKLNTTEKEKDCYDYFYPHPLLMTINQRYDSLTPTLVLAVISFEQIDL